MAIEFQSWVEECGKTVRKVSQITEGFSLIEQKMGSLVYLPYRKKYVFPCPQKDAVLEEVIPFLDSAIWGVL